MKNCAVCSTELKFLTTPLFGAGKLNDGNELCNTCMGKPGMSVNLKKHSLPEVLELIAIRVKEKEDKQAQKIVSAKDPEKAAAEIASKIQKQEEKEQKNQAMQDKWNERKAEEKEEKDQKKQKIEAIKAHIKTLPVDGISTYLGRKEINELPGILSPEETVDNIIQGIYNDGLGILVSTNRRLIFIDKGMLFGIKVEDFPLDKITSIQYETGLLFGKVKLHTSGNVATIEQVDKKMARQFSEFVRDKLSKPKEHMVTVVQAAAPAAPDVLEQLEKLGKLKAAGILSDEEFSEQKGKLLAKL